MAVINYREALTQALREEMQRDDNVFLLGEDIGLFEGAYKVTAGLLKEFGERRVKDTPIAEEVIVGSAIGAGMVGLRPVAEIMTVNFILVAIDQIINNAAKIRYMFGGQVGVPIVIRAPGGSGQQLGAQHSQTLETYFSYVPGLKVVAPATPADAKGLLKTAIRDNDPVIFLENIALYNSRGEVPDGEHLVPIGVSDVKREGKDVTIVSHSRGTIWSLDAAKTLSQEGIEAEVVDLRSLRPLDMGPVLDSVRKTNHAVVVEEGWPTYGVSAEIAARIGEHAFDYLDAPVKRVGGKEVPMPYSKILERAAMTNAQHVVDAVRSLFERTSR
ncbi:MAG: alpha-ketoacid dehydrogenase subunit beta [Chloroflexota bacterium]